MWLDAALNELPEVKEIFSPHPDLQQAIDLIGQTIAGATLMIEQFWSVCWGELPETWETHHAPEDLPL